MAPAPNQTTRGSASLSPPSAPLIYNVVTTAATEFSQLFNNSTKKIRIRCRGTARLRYYFAPASPTYTTVPRGSVEDLEGINFSGTLYFQTSEADTVELTEWV